MVAYIYEHLKPVPPRSLEDHTCLRTILKLIEARVVIQAALPGIGSQEQEEQERKITLGYAASLRLDWAA